MTAHDDAFRDQLAVFALGALPEDEARAVAEHLAGCEECRREYARLRAAADLVGFAAEAAPSEFAGEQCARVKARIMRVARAELPSNVAVARARRPMLGAFAAIAACVALVGVLALSMLRAQDERARLAAVEQRLAAEEKSAAAAAARADDVEKRLAFLLAPGSRHFTVPGGEVVTSGGRVLIAMRLPPPPPGKVYQAWTLKRGAATVAPSITFRPDPNGLALVELPEAAAGLTAVAVSVEPEGGSKAPTSTPTVVRKLS
jgi:anti-sigma-K factor RskA